MSDVSVAITYALLPGFPAGSVVDHITVTCTGGTAANSAPPQNVPADTPTVSFPGLNPDTYTITAQGFPATGDGYGTAVSTTIDLTGGGTISLNLPSALTATSALNLPVQVS